MTHPTPTTERRLFETASAEDLADLATVLRTLSTALATTLATVIESVATDVDALAVAKSGGSPVPASLPTPAPRRRSVADLIGIPEAAPTIAATRPTTVTPPPATPKPLTREEREAAERAAHEAAVAHATALLARPLAIGDDPLALIEDMAETVRSMPRAEFGVTWQTRRNGPDAVEELWRALDARAARIAVAAFACGWTTRQISVAFGIPERDFWRVRDIGREPGRIDRDPEFGDFVRATREERGFDARIV